MDGLLDALEQSPILWGGVVLLIGLVVFALLKRLLKLALVFALGFLAVGAYFAYRGEAPPPGVERVKDRLRRGADEGKRRAKELRERVGEEVGRSARERLREAGSAAEEAVREGAEKVKEGAQSAVEEGEQAARDAVDR